MAALLLEIKGGRRGRNALVQLRRRRTPSSCAVARPVFVDARRDTLNLDENHVEAAITPRTSPVVGMHYAGLPREREPIGSIAARHGVAVSEDAAEALGRPIAECLPGALVVSAAVSFHETKNVTLGRGRCASRQHGGVRPAGGNLSSLQRGWTGVASCGMRWTSIPGSTSDPRTVSSQLNVVVFLLGQLEAAERIRARAAANLLALPWRARGARAGRVLR